LAPQTIDELTSVLPEELEKATHSIVEGYIDDEDRYYQIGEKRKNKLALHFVLDGTKKTIYKIEVYTPNKPERVNSRVDHKHRGSSENLKLIARYRNIEENAVDIKYTDSKTHEEKETTRRGENAGEKTANLLGEHISEFVGSSLEREK
jgi:hypothetical protein